MLKLCASVSAVQRIPLKTIAASSHFVVTSSRLLRRSQCCRSSSATPGSDPLHKSQSGIYAQSILTTNGLRLDLCKSSRQERLHSGLGRNSLDYYRMRCSERRGWRELSLSAKDIVAASPEGVKPYLQLMRIDKPIGTWLVFMPCAWSISLAAPAGQLPDARLLVLCALGAFFMRGAGCTMNDMWDKNFDAQVARTKDRPLPSGRITQFNALVFLAMPLSASLAILLTLNTNTILLGIGAVAPCIVYPLMKRITYWPQVFLGLTFNWGAVMGWSAVQGHLQAATLSLYASCVAWTLVYDTLYAFQDKEDDVKIGVKSTALRFGDSTKLWLAGFTASVATSLTATGYLTSVTWPYYLGVTFFTAHLAHQIYTVDLRNAEDCGNKFRSNRTLGVTFWMFIVAATLLKTDEYDKQKSELVKSSQ